MFKFDHFGVILFVSFSYKNCYNVHFVKIEKIDAKIDFSAKNSKKFVYYNEELVTNSKFQTQLSRELQRFRTCRKNKKCSIFHDLSKYIIFSYGCKLLDWFFKHSACGARPSALLSCVPSGTPIGTPSSVSKRRFRPSLLRSSPNS